MTGHSEADIELQFGFFQPHLRNRTIDHDFPSHQSWGQI